MTRSNRALIVVTGLACLFASSALTAAPGGGGTTTQNVNVVNTPTVNIGSGGPIGVDVLTLPTQPLVATVLENPKPVMTGIAVPANTQVVEFKYTPPAGKRIVIKSIFLANPDYQYAVDWVALTFPGGEQPLPLTLIHGVAGVSIPEATIAVPAGQISIKLWFTVPTTSDRGYNLLMSIYEVPST